MKKLFLLFGILLGLTLMAGGKDTSATPDRIIESYLQAIGGRKSLAAVQDRTLRGQILVMGMAGKFVWHEKLPNKVHQEINLGMVRSAFWFDGDRGYRLDPMLGTGAYTERDVAEAKENYVISPHLAYRDRGWNIRYVGQDSVGGRTVEGVEYIDGLGRIHTHFFDAETSLLVKVVAPQPSAMGQAKQEIALSDYRPVGDVKFPFRIKVTLPSVTSELIIESIEVNTGLPDSVFRCELDPRTILARNLEAVGGLAAWQSLSSIRREARLRIGEMTGETLSIWKEPYRFYHRVDLGEIHHQIGGNGEIGWMNDQLADEAAVRNWKTYAYLFGARYLLPGGIAASQYRGTEKVGERNAHTVDLTLSSGEKVTCFFDQETYFLLKDISRHSAPGIDNVLIETLYEDYRSVGPIKLPFRFRELVPSPPILAEFEVTDYKLNVPVDNALFQEPPATNANR